MIRDRVALLTCAIIFTAVLGGCGGPRNRDAVTYTQADVFAAEWASDGYDAWRHEIDLNEAMPTYSDLGAYPVGNGRLFGVVGLSMPVGTVQDIIGPTYQKVAGLLGTWVPAVLVDGESIAVARQSTRWIAPGGIVHSRWEGESVHVDLLQTVPPELDVIATLILVTNVGGGAIDVSLGLESSLPVERADSGDLLCTRGDIVVRGGFAGAKTSVVNRGVIPHFPAELPERVLPTSRAALEMDSQSVICRLGAVAPDESVGKIAYVAVGTAEDTAVIAQGVEEQGWQLFEDAHRWWQDWHDRTLIVEGAGDEIDQFMAIQKYLCRVQQAEAGGYSPMHKYSFRWIRDSNGPIKFLLDVGDFDSVDRDLSYHFAGCALKRDIYNNIELNLDVDLDDPPQIDWSDVPTQKAESASFVILQNWWYYRHTGETGQLEQRWEYLQRVFDGHEIDAQGRLLFHGDETYRFPGYQLLTAEPEAVSDYVHLTLCSADSGFEYVAAAEAMAEMAARIGRPADEIARYREAARFVREATERWYWQEDRGYYAPAMSAVSGELYRYPFANINTRPTWIGYAGADERQRRNVVSALRWLYRPEAGTTNLTPTCAYTVGMTPGMVLSALTVIEHPEASHALEGLLTAAEASGGFAEMNRPDDTPSREVWGMHRVRPWEGGINGSAVLEYLTGFEPDAPNRAVSLAPRLPRGTETMTVRNLRVADAKLTLEVEPAGEDLAVRVICEEAAQPIAVRVREQRGTLAEGETLAVTVPAPPRAAGTLEVADEPFYYGEADVPAGATVLLTWSGEVAEQVRAREGDVAVIDTRITWPASYLRSALLSAEGSLRAPRLITDIDGWPGGFRVQDYWTDGEGADLLAEYEAAGGVVEKAAVPAAGGMASDELIN
ncbi:MAG: hypothetical protein ACOX9R_14815 [Armatimonadota bacterium]|jgi:hypothetical protein